MRRILVVGGGSIGKRHAGNFKQLGAHVGVVETRADRRAEVTEKIGVGTYEDLDTALKDGYDAVVVGVPTAFHASVAAKSVEAGAHLLIEKPIGNVVADMQKVLKEAERKKLAVLVGYTYRFWPPLLKLKELLDRSVIGRVYSVDIVFSEYLPDWHPWEDYRAWFMSKKELGGGAMLDESHAVDMARWLFGEIGEVFCRTGNLSHLEMTADDYAQFVVSFASGAMGVIHMDLFGRKHRRFLHVCGERGNVSWDFFANRIDIDHVEGRHTEILNFTCERNEMFLTEARHFLDCIEGKAAPVVTGADGLQTLRVLLAGIESSDTKKAIKVPTV
jgi:predicted dehydrogenase